MIRWKTPAIPRGAIYRAHPLSGHLTVSADYQHATEEATAALNMHWPVSCPFLRAFLDQMSLRR